MVKQIKLLTKVQLYNFMGINEFRFSKDKSKRGKTLLLMVTWAFLIVMMCGYIGAAAYGYIMIGLGNVLPMYLTMLAGMIIFIFSLLKAGNMIFQKHGYEMLCSLPVSQTSIVVSRFLSMYVGNLLLAFGIMLPGMAVYAYFERPGITFYIMGVLGTVFIPLLPMTVATFFGAVIAAISSRMKHQGMVNAVLSVILFMAIMAGSMFLGEMGETITPEMLRNLSEMMESMIGKIYPPAVWLGKAMLHADVWKALLYFGLSSLCFVLMVAVVSKNFHQICLKLYGTTAKHDYQMESLKATSVLGTLYKKEVKRYFASSIYVTNTIIGPIMMVLVAGAVFVLDTEQIAGYLMIDSGIVENIVIKAMPFLMAAISCLMTTTCTSISMEGKEWWIVKSLPISAKELFDSKILLNLTIITPFYLVSEILLMIALRPGFVEMIWLVILPVILMTFACVFGITANLLLPSFHWENEVTVVKQSASAVVGGLGGSFVILLCAVPVVVIQQVSVDIVRVVISIIVIGLTVVLYRRNAATNLNELG